MQERPAHMVALAQHPIPDALWAELAAVTPTTDDPEAGRWRQAGASLLSVKAPGHPATPGR